MQIYLKTWQLTSIRSKSMSFYLHSIKHHLSFKMVDSDAAKRQNKWFSGTRDLIHEFHHWMQTSYQVCRSTCAYIHMRMILFTTSHSFSVAGAMCGIKHANKFNLRKSESHAVVFNCDWPAALRMRQHVLTVIISTVIWLARVIRQLYCHLREPGQALIMVKWRGERMRTC